jgi:two-component system response regulator
MKGEPIEVLLVEDDPGDVELTREALDASKLSVNLRVVEDGEKAMDYLRRFGPYAGVAKPDLVILDLNLPRKDGRQVLADIKSDPALRSIPVVVLTTSGAADDIGRMYALGANCYITKPIGMTQFATVVQSIESFWFTIVKLPTRME